MDQKCTIFRQEKKDDGVHPVLDSLDNYKMLSERMNVLTIYLPSRKIGIASDFSMVKTAVLYVYINVHVCTEEGTCVHHV